MLDEGEVENVTIQIVADPVSVRLSDIRLLF